MTKRLGTADERAAGRVGGRDWTSCVEMSRRLVESEELSRWHHGPHVQTLASWCGSGTEMVGVRNLPGKGSLQAVGPVLNCHSQAGILQ